MGAKTSVAESGLTLRSFAVLPPQGSNLRNEFLVNWMFCPLMVLRMSEIKIKKGGFVFLALSLLLWGKNRDRRNGILNTGFAERKLRHSTHVLSTYRPPLVFVFEKMW